MLRNGTVIKNSGNKNTENIANIPFLSVQNSLVGINGKDQFEIGLERVSKIVLRK